MQNAIRDNDRHKILNAIKALINCHAKTDAFCTHRLYR